MLQEVQDSETLTCFRSVSCWTYILKLHTKELIFAKPVLFYLEKSRYCSLLSSLQDLKISFVDRGGRFWCKQTICQFSIPMDNASRNRSVVLKIFVILAFTGKLPFFEVFCYINCTRYSCKRLKERPIRFILKISCKVGVAYNFESHQLTRHEQFKLL